MPAAVVVVGDGAHPVSVDPDATRRALAFGTGVLALALVAAPALRGRRLAQTAACVVVGGAVAVAVYGVAARALFGALLFGSMSVPTIAPFGSFVSKNHFAGYVEMATLLGAGLAWGLADEARRSKAALSWVGSTRAGRVVVAAGATLVMGLAALLSLSRGGALSLAAGALGLVSLRAYVRRKTAPSRSPWIVGLALLALTAAALAALPPEARARLSTLAGMSRDNSGQFRLVAWGDTVRLWARSPLFGHGFGAYADALPPVKTGLGYVTVEHAESDVLELLAEGGLLGLLLAGMALVAFARAVVRGLSRQSDRLLRGLGLGAAAGAAALLVHSVFDFNLRIPSNALLFAFLSALALAAAGAAEPGEGRRPWGALAVAVALAFAVAIPAASTRHLPDEAAAFAVKGGRPVTALRVAQATEALTAHLRLRPADAESWLFLAWLRAAGGTQDDARTLARHAAELDPQRAAIQSEAARIEAATQ
jgi:O-antigen ligase